MRASIRAASGYARLMRDGRGVRFAIFAALVLFVVTIAPFARAAAPVDVAATLEAAEQAYADLEFDRANKLSADVVKQKGLTHDQLVRAYRVLARTHAVLDHDKDARAAFVWLLTIAPDEQEDRKMPPKVTDRMAEARGVLSGYHAKPGMEIVANVRANEAGTLRVTTRDPTRIVKKVVVGFRWGSSGKYTTSEIAVGEVTVDVPTSPANVSRLDYYAQAFDDREDAVFEVGNPAVPKTATFELPKPQDAPPPPKREPKEEKPQGKSIFASPVFWGIVAGVIVVGGVVTYAATRPGSATSASMSPALFCGATRCN